MRKTLSVGLILMMFSLVFTLHASQMEEDILNILTLQKKAWNQGSIEGFMAFYWKSDEFTFQSGNTRLHGWDSLFARYKKSYSGDMGILDFADISIHVLSPEAAYVLGQWQLELKDSKKEGLFTIIFKKTSKGWKIIHDHTS